jgi:hypothetical protein
MTVHQHPGANISQNRVFGGIQSAKTFLPLKTVFAVPEL